MSGLHKCRGRCDPEGDWNLMLDVPLKPTLYSRLFASLFLLDRDANCRLICGLKSELGMKVKAYAS
jgi:hypothetical protein